MLSALGFSKSDIESANDYICGTMMIEGSPHIDPEDLPVFDTANRCGKNGRRLIDYMGHVRMMAAAQPFISGAISKTVNMASESTVEQIGEVYMQSWKMMLKAIALYRDGSKLSQPLNSSMDDIQDEIVTLGDADTLDETKGPKELHEMINAKNQWKPTRKRLPKKRSGFIREANIGQHKVYLRTGDYEDGSLGEIFIDMYKEGASFRGLLNSFAILASKALQYGIPLEELVDTFTFTRFEPAGMVNGHEAISTATSILDYVFRSLGYDYLNRTDFIHKKAIDEVPASKSGKQTHTHGKTDKNKHDKIPVEDSRESSLRDELEAMTVTNTGIETGVQNNSQGMLKGSPGGMKAGDAIRIGYTGEQCGNCGSIRVKRNGSCTVCEDCGYTSGCS